MERSSYTHRIRVPVLAVSLYVWSVFFLSLVYNLFVCNRFSSFRFCFLQRLEYTLSSNQNKEMNIWKTLTLWCLYLSRRMNKLKLKYKATSFQIRIQLTVSGTHHTYRLSYKFPHTHTHTLNAKCKHGRIETDFRNEQTFIQLTRPPIERRAATIVCT